MIGVLVSHKIWMIVTRPKLDVVTRKVALRQQIIIDELLEYIFFQFFNREMGSRVGFANFDDSILSLILADGPPAAASQQSCRVKL